MINSFKRFFGPLPKQQIGLFCSYSNTLKLIREGKVSREELNTGLFYFGCARGLLFNGEDPYNISDEVRGDWCDEDYTIEHNSIIRSLLLAEKEGRVAWRKKLIITQI